MPGHETPATGSVGLADAPPFATELALAVAAAVDVAFAVEVGAAPTGALVGA